MVPQPQDVKMGTLHVELAVFSTQDIYHREEVNQIMKVSG
jgi:hypothetical protein